MQQINGFSRLIKTTYLLSKIKSSMSKLMIFSEALDVGWGGAQTCVKNSSSFSYILYKQKMHYKNAHFQLLKKSSFCSLSDGDLNFSFFRKLAEG